MPLSNQTFCRFSSTKVDWRSCLCRILTLTEKADSRCRILTLTEKADSRSSIASSFFSQIRAAASEIKQKRAAADLSRCAQQQIRMRAAGSLRTPFCRLTRERERERDKHTHTHTHTHERERESLCVCERDLTHLSLPSYWGCRREASSLISGCRT